MRKRTLALLLAGTFVFGTAAACSDDDPADGTDTETTTDAGDTGDGTTTSVPADVEETTTTVAG